jgi:hypothetical protein
MHGTNMKTGTNNLTYPVLRGITVSPSELPTDPLHFQSQRMPNMSHTNPARNKNILIILGKNW